MVLARGWREGKSILLNGCGLLGFCFCFNEQSSGSRQQWWLSNSVKTLHANELSGPKGSRGLWGVLYSTTIVKKFTHSKGKWTQFPFSSSSQRVPRKRPEWTSIWQCVLDSKSEASLCVVPSLPQRPAPGAFPGSLHFCFISKLELRPLETQGSIC